MRWEDGRESDNVEDLRGSGGGGGGGFGGGGFGGGGGGFGIPIPLGRGGLGCGGILVLIVVGLIFGINPLQMLGMGGGGPVVQQQQNPADGADAGPGTVSAPDAGNSAASGSTAGAEDTNKEFVRRILGETEDVWGAIFQQQGATYVRPKLVLFSDSIRSACGGATAAVGPFYCPNDQKVYLDVSFFDLLRQKLGGGGDFAQAYVIAHEVGHHVQKLTGVFDQVEAARSRGAPEEGANGLSVRQELQADCFAGVWAYHAEQRHHWMQAGDIEQAINSAKAIGDDRLQQAGQGYVNPDSFSHGTSAQRVRWFTTGFKSGDPGQCDTFKANPL